MKYGERMKINGEEVKKGTRCDIVGSQGKAV
jgi:hypothetical protein